MRLSWSRYLPLAVTLFVAACTCDSSSPFGRPSRGTSLSADILDSAGTLEVHVIVGLSEVQGDPYPRELGVNFLDPVFGTPSPLAGHIQHVRLLDDALNVVQEITTYAGAAYTSSILAENVKFPSSENGRYEAMRQLFLSGKTTLEIETDLPGQ